MRMRHFLSTYLSFLMARLEYTHAAQLQEVGHSSLVLCPSDTSDPTLQCRGMLPYYYVTDSCQSHQLA